MFWLAETCILAMGWRRRGLAFLAGAIGALGLPPFGVFPAFFITLAVAVWLLDGTGSAGGNRFTPGWRALKLAFSDGWWLGFGYFVAGLWWLGAAFLVEADKFAWLMPLGVLGLPAGLAIFTGLGFVFSRLLWSPGWQRAFALAAGLGLAEFLRGTILTGFPWNAPGMAFGQHVLLAQTASLIGLHGLSICAIAIFALPAVAFDLRGGARTLRRAPVLVSVAGLVGLALFGLVRLSGESDGHVAGVRLRIMQPNLPQDAKFRPDSSFDIVRRYLELSDRATSPQSSGLADVTHLIWPESPFPFALAREPRALDMIGKALAGKTTLLTGAIRVQSIGARPRIFNSLSILDGAGRITDSYDKAHLVPFGEYLPLDGLARAIGLRQFVEIPGGFESGGQRRTLSVPGLPPVAPLICYEAIFPGETVASGGGLRPGVLLNITNDAWFGRTPGPYQHFAQSRLRTIEEGIPMVRAANNGISAIIDSRGRIERELPLGATGVLDGGLPNVLPPTLFARFPLSSIFLVWVFALVFALFPTRKNAT